MMTGSDGPSRVGPAPRARVGSRSELLARPRGRLGRPDGGLGVKPSSQLLPKLAAPIASAIVVVLDTRGGGAVALAAERPALVVVISVDQMRADYLDRFRPWFGDDGFNRFLKTGASFPNAAYRNAAT